MLFFLIFIKTKYVFWFLKNKIIPLWRTENSHLSSLIHFASLYISKVKYLSIKVFIYWEYYYYLKLKKLSNYRCKKSHYYAALDRIIFFSLFCQLIILILGILIYYILFLFERYRFKTMKTFHCRCIFLLYLFLTKHSLRLSFKSSLLFISRNNILFIILFLKY